MTSIYYINPRIMTEINVSATVGEMSATVGEMSATGGGDVRNSGEIEHGVGNLRAEIVIHNSA